MCRAAADAPIPTGAQAAEFFCVVRTAEELSIVCPQNRMDPSVLEQNREGLKVEAGWTALKLEGPFPFSMTGVLASAEKALLEQADPNDYYRQLQAMLGHDVFRPFGGNRNRAAAAVHAKVTVIVASQDHMVNPGPAREFAPLVKASIVELNGDCGHISTGCEAPKVAAAVAQALR